jgi:hypothetical protein
MMPRDRRYGTRRAMPKALKARVGIATAILAGGGVAAAAVLMAASHPAGTAQPAAFSARFDNEGSTLSSAVREWNSSRRNAYSQLAALTQVRGFSQASDRGSTLDVQRGIVVLATSKFLILESANGSLHLWLLSHGTQYQNVANTTAGTSAMTANTTAAQQAMESGNLIPATTLMAGSPITAAALLTPTAAPQTVSVQVVGTDLTVTVTVTRTMATVSQTATMPLDGMPTADASTFTQSAWQATNSVARGDLALVVGTRAHGTLRAQVVLFTPLSTTEVGGRAGSGLAGTRAAATPTALPTHW